MILYERNFVQRDAKFKSVSLHWGHKIRTTKIVYLILHFNEKEFFEIFVTIDQEV